MQLTFELYYLELAIITIKLIIQQAARLSSDKEFQIQTDKQYIGFPKYKESRVFTYKESSVYI